MTGVLTWPNAITVLRLLLLVPVCWILLIPMPPGPGYHLAPMVLLGVWAGTDWADGFLARRFDQASRLGEILDPIADRVGIAAVLCVLAVKGLLPWWVLAVVAGMDIAAVLLAGPAARRGDLHVSAIGKVRTAVLLIGLLGLVIGATALVGTAAGPTTIVWSRIAVFGGTGLHVAAGIDYVWRARRG